MSEWNNSTAEERIAKWRALRTHISSLDEEEKINSIAAFFASVPIGARCIDFYTPDSWPTPWELLYHKLFCASTISLLIYHTLCLAIGEERVTIVLIDDGSDRFLVPLVDKQRIFNYELGMVNNITDCTKLKIVDEFCDIEMHHIK